MAVKPIPEGYQTVVPYLVVPDVQAVLDFIRSTFDATIHERMEGPDGAVMHADVIIGDSHVMLGMAKTAEDAAKGMLYLYIEDTDGTYERGMKSGGESIQAPENQFYGDRNAALRGPAGNQWWLATHVEDVSPEELQKRAAEAK